MARTDLCHWLQAALGVAFRSARRTWRQTPDGASGMWPMAFRAYRCKRSRCRRHWNRDLRVQRPEAMSC